MEKRSLPALLSANAYPGRGIVLGRSPDGRKAVVVYFIMGRSVNSRNRIFVPTEDGIRTQAFDPSKMTDPRLIIYHPVRETEDGLIVTNGDQTDTIRDALRSGGTFASALSGRTFEPDAPNYTPRISGMLRRDGSILLSILKSADGDPSCCCRYLYQYDRPLPGEGRFLHTYAGDGVPLPSFEGEPIRVAMDASGPRELASQIWEALDMDNKVSLFVRYLDPGSREREDVVLNALV